ncbi:hypothetical protein BZZ01_04840 [Nostocales cyanobacterium HT-58-2]|nr:hypothetical protein BZZ01_04840 [Nostocales cyanobacterium HT-58-2]
MIDPSGIKPKNDKLIVKEVKPGVHTIENAYEGVHEDFTTSNFDVVEPSNVEGQSDSTDKSIENWRAAFGTQERTTITIEQLDTNTTTEEDTTRKLKNQ